MILVSLLGLLDAGVQHIKTLLREILDDAVMTLPLLIVAVLH